MHEDDLIRALEFVTQGAKATLPVKLSRETFSTESFQKELRNSPMWDQMVEQFGEQEAEKLIKKCQAKFGT